MFSFRTTPIEDQLDKALRDGRVAVFCSHNSWNPVTGQYLQDIFRQRGNLAKVFHPDESELSPYESHIEFDPDELGGLAAIVVEIQDSGSRYSSHTVDVLRLMNALNALEEAPALYIIDHPNPAGRYVEGTMPVVEADMWTPKVTHRHGLTLGELCQLYLAEIGGRFALHVISADASPVGRTLMPWSIAPSSGLPGLFSALMYSGGALWEGTSITPGIGTTRPYEYIGAPFIHAGGGAPGAPGAWLRPCSFTPAYGLYEGERCEGYQILLIPGEEYHSLLHTLRLMKYFQEHYSMFTLSEQAYARIADPVIEAFLRGEITFDIVEEHVKTEEQKWIRKAKRFALYADLPCRIK